MHESISDEFQNNINDFVKHILPDDVKQSKIRDKKIIHDSVWGSNIYYEHEIAIIDTPLLQRLRKISQTGLVFLTYPCSVHSRFEHTLGVCNLISKFVNALNEKRPNFKKYIDPTTSKGEFAELRMAALLHDCGHCFFSHASEEVYSWHSEIRTLLLNDYFAGCKPHEILSFLIVSSERFRTFFKSYINEDHKADINLDNVSEMIIGKHPEAKLKYQAKILNGSFDADKLDYIYRDSYFSGITLTLDIDRLLYTLDIDEENFDYPELIVRSPVPLEQILFSKMMLFTSIYHHQKVRAAEGTLRALCEYIANNGILLKDRPLSHPVDYLYFTDDDILNENISNNNIFRRMVRNIRNRELLKRCVVICKETVDNYEDCYKYRLEKLTKTNPSNLFEVRKEIFDLLPKDDNFTINELVVDMPKLPSFREAAQTYTSVDLSQQVPVQIDKVFPVDSWLDTYAAIRWKGYVFGPERFQKDVSEKARKILNDKDIKINNLSPIYCHIE